MKFLHVTPVIGLPQVTGWSQVAENPHTARIRIICAFSLQGEQAGNVGRDISEDIAQFEPQTLEEAYIFFENLEKRYEESESSLYFSTGVFMQDQVAYAVKGGSVLLKRDRKAAPIIYSRGDLKFIVGKYTLSDVIVLATHQATSFFNEVQQKFETGFDTDTIITSIVPGLHSQNDSSLASLAFIVPSEKEIEKEEEKVLLDIEATIDSGEDQAVAAALSKAPEKDSKSEADNSDSEEAAASELDAPEISPDNVQAPTEETLSQLGLNEPPPKDAEIHPLLIKLGAISKKILLIFVKGMRILLVKLLAALKTILRSLRTFSFSSLKPDSLKSAIKNKMSEPKQYLGKNKSSKLIKIGILVFFITALAGFGLYLHLDQRKAMRLQAQETLSPFSMSLSKAENTVYIDPVGSRETVAKVIQQLEVLKIEQEELGNDIFVEEISNRLEEAKILHESISGKEEFSDLSVFYDLRLVQADFVVTHADAFESTAAMVDGGQKQLVILNLEQKQPKLVSLESLGNIRGVSVRENDVLILADGIYSVALGSSSEIEKIVEEGDSNRDANLLAAYDRYIYALNPEKRNVYRYAESEDGYSDPVGWMQAARGLVYDTITSWTIDGEIWMASSDGEIKRFESGRSSEFIINGLPSEFNSSLRIATTVDSDQLYILESENRRIVIISKEGDFLREIKSSSLASVSSLMVSEPLGKVLAVSGSIIFEIDL